MRVIRRSVWVAASSSRWPATARRYRAEEGKADAGRDLEQRAVLRARRADEPGEKGAELPLARQLVPLGGELGHGGPELGQLDRRDVDQRCALARASLEHAEELVHRADLGLGRQHAALLQLVDERREVDARAARQVARRGEKPKRREAEGGDGAELD